MSDMADRDDILGMLRYNWDVHGDIEKSRYFNREQLLQICPEILTAWDNYKYSRLVLIALLKNR